MPITVECEICGTKKVRAPSEIRKRVFCSRRCFKKKKYIGLDEYKKCIGCGEPYTKHKLESWNFFYNKRKYCTRECYFDRKEYDPTSEEIIEMDIHGDTFKGIITGMMLGDGYIGGGQPNAFYSMSHTEKQEDYLRYKASLLRNIGKLNISTSYIIDKKHPNPVVKCKTSRNAYYLRLRNIIYPLGKKVVSDKWLRLLNEQGLAIWYMDDGYLSKPKNFNKSGIRRIYGRQVKLCTSGFTKDENEILKTFLKDRFDLEFKLKLHSKRSQLYLLTGGAKTALKLFDIIRPYIIPSMMYKIDMEYRNDGEKYNRYQYD